MESRNKIPIGQIEQSDNQIKEMKVKISPEDILNYTNPIPAIPGIPGKVILIDNLIYRVDGQEGYDGHFFFALSNDEGYEFTSTDDLHDLPHGTIISVNELLGFVQLKRGSGISLTLGHSQMPTQGSQMVIMKILYREIEI